MNFEELLLRAKEDDKRSLDTLASMYRPLLIKQSIVNGVYDEDLYQELWLIFMNCVRKFSI
jgi:hypothetical protein